MSLMAFQTEMPWPFIVLLGLLAYAIGLSISNQRLWRTSYLQKGFAKRRNPISDAPLGGREGQPHIELGDINSAPFFVCEGEDIAQPRFPESGSIHHWVQTIRIAIHNAGGRAIENCQVSITEISPRPDNFSGGTILLSFTDHQGHRSITLKTEPVYVDVVSFLTPFGGTIGGVDGPMRINRIEAPLYIQEREYTITIHVSGESFCGLTKKFRVWAEPQGVRIKMEMLEDQEATKS
ncbi:MAG: hypothetical protein KC643_26625 [Nitrospira sp.]|nr:hypothetical protein [Nitrospira sp.]